MSKEENKEVKEVTYENPTPIKVKAKYTNTKPAKKTKSRPS